MCLATSNNLLLVLQDAPKRIFSTKSRSSGQPKNDAKTLFFHPPSPFPGNFCNCNSGGICTASQFEVQLPLLYTAWRNAYSEIGPELTLRPLATSCAKHHKGHLLVQTSFTEPPNRSLCQYLHHQKLAPMPPLTKPDVLLVMIILTLSTCLL